MHGLGSCKFHETSYHAEAFLELVKNGLLSIEEAAKRADMSVEEFQKELHKA